MGAIDVKTLLKGGLNSLMMAAFSYHQEGVRFGAGAKIGVTLAVAEGLVAAFYPRQQVVVADPSATETDVNNALNAMAQDVIDNEWWNQVNVELSDVIASVHGFNNKWSEVVDESKISVNSNGQLCGADKTFLDEKYDDLNPFKPASLLEQLRRSRYRLETSSLNDALLNGDQLANHKTMTIGIYGMIGSASLAYLNACVAWAWARELQMGWEYESYQRDLADWEKNGRPSQTPTLEQKYAEVNEASGYEPLSWNDFVGTPGCHVRLLLKETKGLFDYCDTLPPPADDETADLFEQTKENWKSIASSVRFEVYTVKKGGEYLNDIAYAKYGDKDFEDSLFKANSDVLDHDIVYPPYDPTVSALGPGRGGPPAFVNDDNNIAPAPAPRGGLIKGGTRLKIFELDALPYNLSPFKGVFVETVPSRPASGSTFDGG